MIKSLKIEGYRTFTHFEMNELAKVNLLVGTNNSGKTTVLEALYLLATNADLQALLKITSSRSEHRFYEIVAQRSLQPEIEINHLFYQHKIDIGTDFKIESRDSNPQAIEFKIIDPTKIPNVPMIFQPAEMNGTPPRYGLQIQSNETSKMFVPLTERSTIRQDLIQVIPNQLGRREPTNNVQYISVGSLTSQELNIAWSNIVLTPEENDVIAALKFLDPDIEKIASNNAPIVIGQFPQRGGFIAKMRGINQPVPIGSLGDGIWRMLALAVSLIRSRNGILIIDEIDTGLHFSTMKNMWTMITQAADAFNIQVFATTHSYDCVRALASVRSDEVSVQRVEPAKGKSVPYNAEELRIAAQHDIEVR